ncbi:MAG: YqgE/AlgH family protein [Bacteroidota bacterium]
MNEFFNYKSRLKPEKGRVLISEPYLPDPNFERTVVLLCEHNDDGSFGFVLNRPSGLFFEDIIDQGKGFKEKIYVGGPVQQDTLHFLHRAEYLEGGEPVMDDCLWGGNFEQLMTLIENNTLDPEDFRFFIGYSGWGAGQLEDELEANSWIVSDILNQKMVFDYRPEDLWREVLKEMGGKFNMYSNYPIDPRLN